MLSLRYKIWGDDYVVNTTRQEHIRKIAREFFQEPSLINDYYYSNLISGDNKGKNLNEIFILKNGKNNNFGKFIYQVIGEELKDDFKLSELIDREIVATIHHYYNDSGLGYANIAFCRPVKNRLEE